MITVRREEKVKDEVTVFQLVVRKDSSDFYVTEDPVTFGWSLYELNRASKVEDETFGFIWVCGKVSSKELTEDVARELADFFVAQTC